MSIRIRTIGDGGINWNWYLCAEFNDIEKTVHVFYYQRWHKYENDAKHPKGAEWTVHSQFTLLEDSNRILYGIRMGAIEYLVTNPAYVFSYRDMTHYVPEK